MQQNKADDNEFKARLFAYKWAKGNLLNRNAKPLTAELNSESNANSLSYSVLLIGDNNLSELKKVCFSSEVENNFAIVTRFDIECKEKLKKVEKFNDVNDNSQTKGKPTESHSQKAIKGKVYCLKLY